MKNKEIKVNDDITIVVGNIYEVVPKFDGNAPDGLRELRTTKFPSHVGRNIEAVPFDSDRGMWDTGLYRESPCYAHKKDVDSLVSQLQKFIVEPLSVEVGEDRLTHRDVDKSYWENFHIRLHAGRVFNTEDPRQLLELFLACIHGYLAPRDKESSPVYRTAQFCIENKEQVVSIKQENDLLDVQASGLFYTYMSSKPSTLQLILNYIGLKLPAGEVREETIASVFKLYCNHKTDGYNNKKTFVDTIKKAETDEGYSEIFYFDVLSKMFKKKQITRQKENFLFDETFLGTSLKEAAEKVAKSKDLQIAIEAVYEGKSKK